MATIIPRRDEILVGPQGRMTERWIKYFENLNFETNNITTIVETEIQIAGTSANPDLILAQSVEAANQQENLFNIMTDLKSATQRALSEQSKSNKKIIDLENQVSALADENRHNLSELNKITQNINDLTQLQAV